MSELVQHVHIGDRTPTGIDWVEQMSYRVPADHRRHILDRERAQGITPSADGWLWCAERRVTDELSVVTRIRWDDPKWFAHGDTQ